MLFIFVFFYFLFLSIADFVASMFVVLCGFPLAYPFVVAVVSGFLLLVAVPKVLALGLHTCEYL